MCVDRQDRVRSARRQIQPEPGGVCVSNARACAMWNSGEGGGGMHVRVERKAGDGADPLAEEALVVSDLVEFEPFKVLHVDLLALRAAGDDRRVGMHRKGRHIPRTRRERLFVCVCVCGVCSVCGVCVRQ